MIKLKLMIHVYNGNGLFEVQSVNIFSDSCWNDSKTDGMYRL